MSRHSCTGSRASQEMYGKSKQKNPFEMKKFVDNVLSQVSEKLAVYVRRAGIGDAAKLINLNIAFRCLDELRFVEHFCFNFLFLQT